MTESELRGIALLQNPRTNKGTAFSHEERDRLGLTGLLPHGVSSIEQQKSRTLFNIRRKENNIEKYVQLMALQTRNERLFYRLVIDHIEEMMPYIYTPTVGQACQEFSHVFRETRGCYIRLQDRGRVGEVLEHWPERDVRLIVVTDGERILGLGDLGANGMGIPIGKLALYCACAGIPPEQCLPIMLDVGTNNVALRDDNLYLGVPEPRATGDEYHGLVEELVREIQQQFPRALIQFEDFLTPNAISLLETYRDQALCFNDDIQGTAAVTLAGVYSACRASGIPFTDLRVMFLGAGSAATGIGDLICAALVDEGLDPSEARRRLWFVDSSGLVVAERGDLAEHKKPYAHDHPAADLPSAIRSISPQCLIGATGAPGTFDAPVLRLMAEINDRPVIFALSNPTSRAECTAEEAYAGTQGRALFASGSPFAPVQFNGKTYIPGQGNNAYVFPGIGLGALACEARILTDAMFLSAARTLASVVSEERLDHGALYPPLTDIRSVSVAIAEAVAEEGFASGVARIERPTDLKAAIVDSMYDPRY